MERTRDCMTLPAVLSADDIERAKLPALYLAAREALQACERVDECKDLQDFYSAMARYAKQLQNKDLLILANKIALRAERRLGELLETIPKTYIKGQGREATAKAHGVSSTVAYRAMAIARVPSQEFEAAVESDNPPGREEYAKSARNKPPDRPSDKRRATLSTLQNFVRFWENNPVEALGYSFTDPTANAKARVLLLRCEEHLRNFAFKLTEIEQQ